MQANLCFLLLYLIHFKQILNNFTMYAPLLNFFPLKSGSVGNGITQFFNKFPSKM